MLLAVAIFAVSCESEVSTLALDERNLSIEESNSKYLLNYRTLYRMDKPTGSIVLQSNATGKGVNTRKTITMSQKGGENNELLRIQSGNESITSFTNHTPNGELSSLFGKNLILNKNNARSPSDSLYIPEELIVDFSSTTIEAGTIINWNADSQNENGLAVFVSYNPLLQANVNLAMNNQYLIDEVFTLSEGNGSYTLTQQDIDRFPEGATLDFRILRGAYAAAIESEPAFVAFTMVSNDVKVK